MISSKRWVSLACCGVLAAVAGAAVAATPSTGGGGPSASVPLYDPVVEYKAGVAAFQASKFKDAIKSFDNVLSVTPDDVNTLMLKGMSQSNLSDLRGASRRLFAAIPSWPNPIASWP